MRVRRDSKGHTCGEAPKVARAAGGHEALCVVSRACVAAPRARCVRCRWFIVVHVCVLAFAALLAGWHSRERRANVVHSMRRVRTTVNTSKHQTYRLPASQPSTFGKGTVGEYSRASRW